MRTAVQILAAAALGALAFSSAALAQAPGAPAAGPVGIVDDPCPPPPVLPGPGERASITPERQAALLAEMNYRRTLDRGGVCTFRAENAAIAAGTAPQPTVIFLGDSITAGWPRLDSAFFTTNKFTGRGIGGHVTSQGVLRFQADVANLHPKVVHIMLGTNDIIGIDGYIAYGNVQNNLMAMVSMARANNIAVVLATVPPMTVRGPSPNSSRLTNVVHINEWIRAYAKRENLALADYYPALADAGGGLRADLTADGLHPTLVGYQIMDPIALAAIKSALATQKHR